METWLCSLCPFPEHLSQDGYWEGSLGKILDQLGMRGLLGKERNN